MQWINKLASWQVNKEHRTNRNRWRKEEIGKKKGLGVERWSTMKQNRNEMEKRRDGEISESRVIEKGER